jgi:hypothetical protein
MRSIIFGVGLVFRDFFGDDAVQMSDLGIFLSPFSEMFMWVNSIDILWVRLSG